MTTTAHPDAREFEERYRAIAARDTRFDGQFFTAVSSTGIYCRPSCPARTPKPENVTFYLTSAAAHEAGYRACKRCLPEAAPGTPAWDLRRDLAGRAMRLIADGVVDREGTDGLAAHLGYSARHVHRLLTAELGAGPLALARAQRAQTARSLVVGTDLPLADVAFAAGFGSIRQFNDTMTEVFAVAPSELRARARRRPPAFRHGISLAGGPGPAADRGDVARVRLDLELPVREP
ncbi:bifunctional transcriptional activator/DNA repair enzyme AdaA, partial [Isoptericola sp. QY 916]|nr:methylphosphotriester-DNA--protein-cysteine methyltransferase family protein [Isoptericola sp. QY 916]